MIVVVNIDTARRPVVQHQLSKSRRERVSRSTGLLKLRHTVSVAVCLDFKNGGKLFRREFGVGSQALTPHVLTDACNAGPHPRAAVKHSGYEF